MVELAVPRLADLCVIDLATEGGLRRAASRYRDPARQHLADELRQLHRAHRGEPHPSIRALREARTQWVRSVTDDLLRAVSALWARVVEANGEERDYSTLILPLERRAGVVVGG